MENIYLGGYTRKTNKGIHQIKIKEKSLLETDLIPEEGASYLAINKDMLYSVTSREGGGIVGYRKLEDGYIRISEYLGMGKAPCHIYIDEERELIYASNYHLGRVDIFRDGKDGLKLLNRIEIEDEIEKGIEGNKEENKIKQSKCHMAILDNTGEYLIVVNLGLDKVYTYKIDKDANYKLKNVYMTKEGMGPRHIYFEENEKEEDEQEKNEKEVNKSSKRAYLIGELNNTIEILEYKDGCFKKISSVNLLDSGFSEASSAAAIKGNKNCIYASNRGEDSIVVFKPSEEGLEVFQRIETGGRNPRDFGFNRDGSLLIVGHQDSELVSFFDVAEDGSLKRNPDLFLELDEIICVINEKK